jgi:hypothetical protein
MLVFNILQTESEHEGFFSMYINPKAHYSKIFEDTQLTEMTEVSLLLL